MEKEDANCLNKDGCENFHFKGEELSEKTTKFGVYVISIWCF